MTEQRSTVGILRAARERISDPRNHAVGAQARDHLGREVPPDSPTAVKWCAYASIECEVIKSGGDYGLASGLLREAAAKTTDRNPSQINDWGGHAATLALFDLAVELAEARS